MKLVLNKRGHLVREHAPHATRPAVDRFKEMIELRDGRAVLPCMIWKGGKKFRIDAETVMSPQRFAWEHHHGKPIAKGQKVVITCGTLDCCRYEHLALRTSRKTKDVSE